MQVFNKFTVLKIYTLDRKPGVAKKLSRKFGGKSDIIFTEDRLSSLNKEDIILNYGKSVSPSWASVLDQMPVRVLNHWDAVSHSVDKIKTFKALNASNVPCLRWTTKAEDAIYFERVMARCQVRGTKGAGLLVIEEPCKNKLPDAPLYTEYYGQTHEFRVHVFNNKIIDYTQKKKLNSDKLRERGITPIKYIRSHSNGWIFSRQDIIRSEEIEQLALDATKAVGLDFGGIDIVAKVKKGKVLSSVVCETNAAPGMINSTFSAYTDAISKLLEEGNI